MARGDADIYLRLPQASGGDDKVSYTWSMPYNTACSPSVK